MNITELCVNGKKNNSCTMCWKTSNKKCPHFVQKTNADRIRSMSDDELAAFLCNLRSEEVYGNACSNCVAERFCRIGHTGMIDWLKQPVEGG